MMGNNDKTLVSIITVVYNGCAIIEDTIKSVIEQTYKNIQYIIIDGNSSDGTVNIIEKYKSHIDTFLSENDKGIYDAMNKGLCKAKGDFVIFMNAGDYFNNNDVINNFIKIKPDKNMSYYGNVTYFSNNTSYVFKSKLSSKYCFLKHNTFSHQAIFYSKKCLDNIGGYNLRLRVSADFDLTYRMVKKTKFINLNTIIARCNADGYSTNNGIQSYKDRMLCFKNEKDYLFYVILLVCFPVFFLKNIVVKKSRNSKLYKIYRKIKYRGISEI